MKTTLLLILATLNLGISQTAWSMTDQDTKQIAVKYSNQFPKADGTDPYNSSIEIFLKTPTVHLILIRTNIQSYQIGCSFKVWSCPYLNGHFV